MSVEKGRKGTIELSGIVVQAINLARDQKKIEGSTLTLNEEKEIIAFWGHDSGVFLESEELRQLKTADEEGVQKS